mgnify:FL=1
MMHTVIVSASIQVFKNWVLIQSTFGIAINGIEMYGVTGRE